MKYTAGTMRTMKEGDRNFGRALVVWDMVFRHSTIARPANDPAQVGLYLPTRYPARSTFEQQVWSMFLPGCCRRAA